MLCTLVPLFSIFDILVDPMIMAEIITTRIDPHPQSRIDLSRNQRSLIMLTSHQGISCLEVFNWLVMVCGIHWCQSEECSEWRGGMWAMFCLGILLKIFLEMLFDFWFIHQNILNFCYAVSLKNIDYWINMFFSAWIMLILSHL